MHGPTAEQAVDQFHVQLVYAVDHRFRVDGQISGVHLLGVQAVPARPCTVGMRVRSVHAVRQRYDQIKARLLRLREHAKEQNQFEAD